MTLITGDKFMETTCHIARLQNLLSENYNQKYNITSFAAYNNNV